MRVCALERSTDTAATIIRKESTKRIKSKEVITKTESKHTCLILVKKPWAVLLCVHPVVFLGTAGVELHYVLV